MELKELGPIYALLLAIGIVFGTYTEFVNGVPFGFAWFINMLWFVIGFPALFIIGTTFYKLAVQAQEKLEE